MRRQTRAMRLLIAILLLLAAPALADGHHQSARDAVAAGKIRPLGEVLATVSRAFPGRALDVRLGGGSGAWVYRVKVLATDGTVVSVTVDARSGRIVGVRGPRR